MRMHDAAINHKLAVDKNLKTNDNKSKISMNSNNTNYKDNMQYMTSTKDGFELQRI